MAHRGRLLLAGMLAAALMLACQAANAEPRIAGRANGAKRLMLNSP